MKRPRPPARPFQIIQVRSFVDGDLSLVRFQFVLVGLAALGVRQKRGVEVLIGFVLAATVAHEDARVAVLKAGKSRGAGTLDLEADLPDVLAAVRDAHNVAVDLRNGLVVLSAGRAGLELTACWVRPVFLWARGLRDEAAERG